MIIRLCCTLFYHILHVKCPQSPVQFWLGPKQVISFLFADNRSDLVACCLPQSFAHFIANMPLILSLYAHCLPLNSSQLRIRAWKGLFYHFHRTGNPSFILAELRRPMLMPAALLVIRSCEWIIIKLNPSFTFYSVILFMTGRGVRFTLATGVSSYTFQYWVMKMMTHHVFHILTNESTVRFCISWVGPHSYHFVLTRFTDNKSLFIFYHCK